jgi:agmatinase
MGPVAVLHFDAHLFTWDVRFGARITHGTRSAAPRRKRLIDMEASLHVGIRSSLYPATTSATTNA